VPKIAYFGPQGTFTEQAARALSGNESILSTDSAQTHSDQPRIDELVPLETIPLALNAVREGLLDAACVPVENSVEGAVTATLDSLVGGEPLVTVAESILPIHFSVLTRHETEKADIRTVASHPHALAQVRFWVEENLPGAQAVATSSTAAAAVAVQRGEFDAAVTAPVAVEHYPLRVLATGVADVADAQTRFLLLRRPGLIPRPTGADRTSIVASMPNRIGALSELLTELTFRDINLTKLDARPTRDNLGEYHFFIDFEGHLSEPRIGDALASLHRRCDQVRFLGSHPRADEAVSSAVRRGSITSGTNAEFTAAVDWVAAVRRGKLA
jgi:prephenate dehydratase